MAVQDEVLSTIGPVTYNLNHYLRGSLDSPIVGQNNQFIPLRIREAVQPDDLKAALFKLCETHASLRTSFHLKNDTFYQHINDDWREYFSFRSEQYGANIPQTAIAVAIANLHEHKFPPNEPCAFAITSLHATDETLILAYLSHNIIDAWGMRILTEDLAQLLSSDSMEKDHSLLSNRYNAITIAEDEARHLVALDGHSVDEQCAALLPILRKNKEREAPMGHVLSRQSSIPWAQWSETKRHAVVHYGSVELFLLSTVARHDMSVHNTGATIVNVLDANRSTTARRRVIMDLANVIPVPVYHSDLESSEALNALHERVQRLRRTAVPFWFLCDQIDDDLISTRYGVGALTVSIYPVGTRHRTKGFTLAANLMRPPTYPHFDLMLHYGPMMKGEAIPVNLFLNSESQHANHTDDLFSALQNP